MTDITDVLRRAADVQPPIDVAADLRRGRAFSRRRRTRVTAVATGGVLAAGALVTGVVVAGHHDGPAGVARPEVATQPPHADHHHRAVRPKTKHHAPPVHRTIHATVIGADSLTHTRYFLVPPSPTGWHLVGTTFNYILVARHGTQPPLQGGFQGHLVVGLTAGSVDYPTTSGTPLDFDGRVFWQWHDSGNTMIAVRDHQGDWIIAQYPDSAGFELSRMVAYLDAVRPLAGTMTAS